MSTHLGNKEIMAQNIQYYMDLNGKTRKDVCEALGIKYTTLTDWIKGNTYPRIDSIEMMANYFGIEKSDLVENRNKSDLIEEKTDTKPRGYKIPILSSVPAGIPIEAIEDVIGWEEIPMEWINDCEYFALKVKGDSMYPKYLDGDIVIIKVQPDCESGQDAVVYVNGYDATLKKVIKQPFGIMLQPLNPEYEPKFYEYSQETITVAGIVVEIRRKV